MLKSVSVEGGAKVSLFTRFGLGGTDSWIFLNSQNWKKDGKEMRSEARRTYLDTGKEVQLRDRQPSTEVGKLSLRQLRKYYSLPTARKTKQKEERQIGRKIGRQESRDRDGAPQYTAPLSLVVRRWMRNRDTRSSLKEVKIVGSWRELNFAFLVICFITFEFLLYYSWKFHVPILHPFNGTLTEWT